MTGDVDSIADHTGSDTKARVNAVQGTIEITCGEVDDLEAVKKYVRRKIGQIKNCYEQQLKQYPNLSGKVELTWTVLPNGSATGVRAYSNTSGNSELEQCIVRRIKRWKLPTCQEEYEVTYTFNLSQE